MHTWLNISMCRARLGHVNVNAIKRMKNVGLIFLSF